MPAPDKRLIISNQLEPLLVHLQPHIPLHLWISSSVLTEKTDVANVYAQLMHRHIPLRTVYAVGQGAQAANLEDCFNALWEAQQENMDVLADKDVLLSIACPYEDEDFEFITSVMFLNAHFEDEADAHAGAGQYAAWFNPDIAFETHAIASLLNMAKQTQTTILHVSGL